MANLSPPEGNRNHFINEVWMTTADAMVYFRVSRRTLQRWCQDKQIYFVYMGGTKYYPQKFIEHFMLTKINRPLGDNRESAPEGGAAPA